MKEGYTHISFVIDRSGSMQSVKSDTIGGFNKFLAEQKEVDCECTFTYCQFDDEYEVVHDFVNVKDVPELTDATFQPRGWTAMYDAIGRQIVETGNKLGALSEDQRPDKIIFVVLTDGAENRSREYNGSKVKEMITHQTEKYGWAFMFLGANINAEAVGSSLGIDADFTSTFATSAAGMESTFDLLAAKTAGMRRSAGPLYCMGKKTPIAAAYSYTAEDKAQMQA